MNASQHGEHFVLERNGFVTVWDVVSVVLVDHFGQMGQLASKLADVIGDGLVLPGAICAELVDETPQLIGKHHLAVRRPRTAWTSRASLPVQNDGHAPAVFAHVVDLQTVVGLVTKLLFGDECRVLAYEACDVFDQIQDPMHVR